MAEAEAGRPGAGRPAPVADPVEKPVFGVGHPQLGDDLLLAPSRLVGDHGGVDHRSPESGGLECPAQARFQAIEPRRHHLIDPLGRTRQLPLAYLEAPQSLANDLLFQQPAGVMLGPQRVALRRTHDPFPQLVSQLPSHSGAGQLEDRLALQSANCELHRAGADPVEDLLERRRSIGGQRFVCHDDQRRQRPQRATEPRQQVERRAVAPLQVVECEDERPYPENRPAQRQELIEQGRAARGLGGIGKPAGRRFPNQRGQAGIAAGLVQLGEDFAEGAVGSIGGLVLDAVGGQRDGPRVLRANLPEKSLGQRRLADACRAGQRDEAPAGFPILTDLFEDPAELCQLRGPADEAANGPLLAHDHPSPFAAFTAAPERPDRTPGPFTSALRHLQDAGPEPLRHRHDGKPWHAHQFPLGEGSLRLDLRQRHRLSQSFLRDDVEDDETLVLALGIAVRFTLDPGDADDRLLLAGVIEEGSVPRAHLAHVLERHGVADAVPARARFTFQIFERVLSRLAFQQPVARHYSTSACSSDSAKLSRRTTLITPFTFRIALMIFIR